jgi:hypothetical protein
MPLRRGDPQPASARRENHPTGAEANLELAAKDLHPLVVIVRVLDLKVTARLEDEKETRSELVDRVPASEPPPSHSAKCLAAFPPM